MSFKFHALLLPFNSYRAIISRNITVSAKHYAHSSFSRPQVFKRGKRGNYFLVHHLSTSCSSDHTSPPSPPRLYSVLFYGSDDFSLDSLRLLHSKLVDINNENLPNNDIRNVGIKRLEIVTTSESNQVYNYCRKMDLPCHAFGSYSIPPNVFDFGVASSFGRLIPKQAIEACHHGILNIHGSLLPRWRGASPIQHAILANDKVTGLTIMRIQPKKFDVGQIVAQRRIEIFYRITSQNLRHMMAPLGAELLWEVIQNLEASLAFAYDQPEEGVTYAPKLKESDGEIHWKLMDATEIDRRCRAFCGCIDVYTHWIDGTQLKLSDVVDPDLVARLNLTESTGLTEHIPGLVQYHKGRHLLCIASAAGTWSGFRSLTLKGRRKMSALGFYNTFMRPLSKMYRGAHEGAKPIFLFGHDPYQLDQNCPQSEHLISVQNFGQLQLMHLPFANKVVQF